MRINIARESDEFPLIQIDKIDGGVFNFSDDNVSDVECVLYDSDDTVIGTYTESGGTLVFVTLSYEDDKLVTTASDDSEWFEIRLLGTATAGKDTGYVKAKVTISWTNVNFPDNTYDKIIPVTELDYYLV